MVANNVASMRDADTALKQLQAMPNEVIQHVLEFADIKERVSMPVKILRVANAISPYFLVVFSAMAIPALIMTLLGGKIGNNAAGYV